LLALRDTVFDVAASIDGVGPIEETLRWGEPAYLTSASRSGSTIRLGWKRAVPTECAMYFICTTNLVETFRVHFPHELIYGGNRAIIFRAGAKIHQGAAEFCIAAALTYHWGKDSTKSPAARSRKA
jgi:hypothetical protein